MTYLWCPTVWCLEVVMAGTVGTGLVEGLWYGCHCTLRFPCGTVPPGTPPPKAGPETFRVSLGTGLSPGTAGPQHRIPSQTPCFDATASGEDSSRCWPNFFVSVFFSAVLSRDRHHWGTIAGRFCNCRCCVDLLEQFVSSQPGAVPVVHLCSPMFTFQNMVGRVCQLSGKLSGKNETSYRGYMLTKRPKMPSFPPFSNLFHWFQVLFSSEFPQFMQLGASHWQPLAERHLEPWNATWQRGTWYSQIAEFNPKPCPCRLETQLKFSISCRKPLKIP